MKRWSIVLLSLALISCSAELDISMSFVNNLSESVSNLSVRTTDTTVFTANLAPGETSPTNDFSVSTKRRNLTEGLHEPVYIYIGDIKTNVLENLETYSNTISVGIHEEFSIILTTNTMTGLYSIKSNKKLKFIY